MQKLKNEVRTLSDQMEEYSLMRKKIEQLRKELINNSAWDIIEYEGEYYAVDMYDSHWRINVELRERLPNSYFHSFSCDECIIGYDPFTGAIVYDLWQVWKTEMIVSEGIFSDFYDARVGIRSLLYSLKKCGFGDKVPPIHILTKDFINYQNDLHGSMDDWGVDITIVKDNISEYASDQSEDFKSTYQKILDDLKKEYNALE